MIGVLNKEDEGTIYVYQVLEKFEKETLSPLFNNKVMRQLDPNWYYESKVPDSDPRLKFLFTKRYAFFPPEAIEIHEILKKYPIVTSACKEAKIYTIYETKEVIKEVLYIPLYTPVKNWILSKFEKKVKYDWRGEPFTFKEIFGDNPSHD